MTDTVLDLKIVKPVPKLHHVKITSPDGHGYLTRVEIDGQELRGVSLVKFEIGPIGYKQNDAVLTLKLFADVEIEGEPEIVKEWRRVAAE